MYVLVCTAQYVLVCTVSKIIKCIRGNRLSQIKDIAQCDSCMLAYSKNIAYKGHFFYSAKFYWIYVSGYIIQGKYPLRARHVFSLHGSWWKISWWVKMWALSSRDNDMRFSTTMVTSFCALKGLDFFLCNNMSAWRNLFIPPASPW